MALFQIEEPPAKKKKRDGPVKISIPSLKQLKQLEEEEEGSTSTVKHLLFLYVLKIVRK